MRTALTLHDLQLGRFFQRLVALEVLFPAPLLGWADVFESFKPTLQPSAFPVVDCDEIQEAEDAPRRE